MRKKLLALVMCATMVLGSSAVAFAAPSDDDYKNAKKIYDNSENIVNELYKEQKDAVTETVWVKAVQSNVTFGFTNDDNRAAVKLNDDKKALTYVGDAIDVSNVNGTSTANQIVNGSVTTLGSVILADAQSKGLDTTKTLADQKYNKVIYRAVDNMGLTHVAYAKVTGTTIDAKDAVASDITVLTSKKVYVNGVETTVYYTADGYSFVESGADLFKADTKSVTGDGIKCIRYDMFKANTENDSLFTLAKALETGALTKDAVAVKLAAYSVVGDKDNAGYTGKEPVAQNTLKLGKVTTPTAGYTVTSLSDLLSRTNLKNSVNIFHLNMESGTTDYEAGAIVYPISTIAKDVVISDSKFTFDVTFTGDSDVIIFDQAGDASNNDGVADTTTAAAASTTNSPKTGDVAPIAALAVVMMGACGAMVVASKKRA